MHAIRVFVTRGAITAQMFVLGMGLLKNRYKKQKAKTYIKLGPTPKLSESNKEIIREMINERLEENLQVTYRNAGTNIVESYNRAFLKACQKISAFTRNYQSRHCKSIVMINEGLVKGSKLINNVLNISLPKKVVARQTKLQRKRLRLRAWSMSLKAKVRHAARTTFLQNLYRIKRQGKREKRQYGKAIDWQ